jgi:prepilin-type N-terminal cleavage/methylation domain-containing protein/prepilin-type processing-associated H-X9-DG protein
MRLRRAGFTLTEVLIVIAVIALLAAVLLPVLARARERGRQTKCLSNLRQVGLALSMYVDAYDGLYPTVLAKAPSRDSPSGFDLNSVADWTEMVADRLKDKRVQRCPSDSAPEQGFESSYALNAWFEYHVTQSDVTHPAETILLAERLNNPETEKQPEHFVWWLWQGKTWPPADTPDPTPTANRELALTRHNGQSDYLYADGHVKSLPFSATWKPGKENPYWPTR